MMKAPYKDFLGSDIMIGDTLIHPSGEKFTVIYDVNHSNNYRALYDDGVSLWLGNQVGEKGQAIIYHEKS